MHHKALLKQIFQEVLSVLDMHPGHVREPLPTLSMVSAVLPDCDGRLPGQRSLPPAPYPLLGQL